MAENSGISWTDHTFNPWMGCTKVSPACTNCYAERDMDKRYGKVSWGPKGTRVLTSDSNWKKPIAWDRDAGEKGIRYRVFCASLADVFEDWNGPIHDNKGNALRISEDGRITDCIDWTRPLTMGDVRNRLFALIDATPNLDWLLLTKRPENINGMVPVGPNIKLSKELAHYRRNVWLGTSVEHSDYLTRIDSLKSVFDMANFLFLSCEPLVGPIPTLGEYLDGIDWVIAGGESGPDARPSHPDWFRSIRDQCEAVGVPFHFKQWGEWLPIDHANPSHDGSRESDVWRDKPSRDDLPMLTLRVGTKAAGRILDDVLHDAFPPADLAAAATTESAKDK